MISQSRCLEWCFHFAWFQEKTSHFQSNSLFVSIYHFQQLFTNIKVSTRLISRCSPYKRCPVKGVASMFPDSCHFLNAIWLMLTHNIIHWTLQNLNPHHFPSFISHPATGSIMVSLQTNLTPWFSLLAQSAVSSIARLTLMRMIALWFSILRYHLYLFLFLNLRDALNPSVTVRLTPTFPHCKATSLVTAVLKMPASNISVMPSYVFCVFLTRSAVNTVLHYMHELHDRPTHNWQNKVDNFSEQVKHTGLEPEAVFGQNESGSWARIFLPKFGGTFIAATLIV